MVAGNHQETTAQPPPWLAHLTVAEAKKPPGGERPRTAENKISTYKQLRTSTTTQQRLLNLRGLACVPPSAICAGGGADERGGRADQGPLLQADPIDGTHLLGNVRVPPAAQPSPAHITTCHCSCCTAQQYPRHPGALKIIRGGAAAGTQEFFELVIACARHVQRTAAD